MTAKTVPEGNDTPGTAKTGPPAMMNQVTVVGRTCTAIQLRPTPTGQVANQRIAVACRGGTTNFFTVTFWNGSALVAQKYLTVGRLAAFQGALVSKTWSAQDGSTRESVSINVERFFFLDKLTKKEVA